MKFEPVWISSIEHLEQFDELIARTPKWRRSLGFYRFPDEFPRVDMGRKVFGKPMMVPLIMLSQGQLTIESGTLHFRAMDWSTIAVGRSTATRHCLRTSWEFSLRADDIQLVESYVRQSPLLPNFSLPFTRVRSYHREAALKDFLICVGGNGNEMDKIREQSAQLFSELQRLKSV